MISYCSLDLNVHDSCLHLCLFAWCTRVWCACVSVGIDSVKMHPYHFVFYSTPMSLPCSPPPSFFILQISISHPGHNGIFDPDQSLSWGLDCAFTMLSSSSILGLYPLDAGRASAHALTTKIVPRCYLGKWR